MTTIAFDGRYLAADRLMVFNDNDKCPMPVCKIDVVTDDDDGKPVALVASTGLITARWRDALVTWWANGRAPHHMPAAGSQPSAGTFIVIRLDGSVEVFTYENPYGTDVGAPDAWGSGCDYAIGAMLCGHTAMEAVDAASKRCPRTGGGVEFIDLQDVAAGVQEWDGVMPSKRFPMPQLDQPLTMALTDINNALDEVEARADQWVRVSKPRKHTTASDPVGAWLMPECTGRLALGTGCGHCLRCNREWHVLLKGEHTPVEWSNGSVVEAVEIPPSRVMAMTPGFGTASDDLAHDAIRVEPAAPPSPREQLEAMVSMYNDAARRRDRNAVQKIDRAFREFHFPPGVEMVGDPEDGGIFIRRLIWPEDGGAA